MADVQSQRAFQKQEGIFQNSKKLLAKKTSKGVRYWKEVGLGFKVPKEAIEGHYIDKKCPFTGNVSVRGAILKGIVISTKMTRTIIIRRDYLHYVAKYNRYEKRHRNVPVHISPAFGPVNEGDIVVCGQCRIFKFESDNVNEKYKERNYTNEFNMKRPLSKTVRFNVLKVIPNEIIGNVRKQFVLF